MQSSGTIPILLLFSFPLFSSCANGMNIALSYRNKINPRVDRIKQHLIAFYVCTGIIWFSIILIQFNWENYSYINSVYYSFSLLWSVLFYQFITDMTTPDGNQSSHYILPCLFFIILLVYPFFRPLNINFQLLNQQILVDPTYKESSFLIYPLAVFRRIFMAFYGILSFRRLAQIQTDNSQFRYKKWLWSIWGIYCIIFLVTFLRLFDYNNIWPIAIYTVIMAVSLVAMQSIICFNILEENYKFNSEETLTDNSEKRKYRNFQKTKYKSYQQKKRKVSVVIDQAEFENYFKRCKPYLNPNLKIEDLTDDFNACRSILSAFVNKTYGMSFSQYVNNWRLNELERIGKLKQNKCKDIKELVGKAGFGSYRSYLRARSLFENKDKVK